MVEWLILLCIWEVQGSDLSPETTERRGWVVNTPASYLGGPGLDYRPRRQEIQIEVFREFPQTLQAKAGIVP
jgi:hypothetical protein